MLLSLPLREMDPPSTCIRDFDRGGSFFPFRHPFRAFSSSPPSPDDVRARLEFRSKRLGRTASSVALRDRDLSPFFQRAPLKSFVSAVLLGFSRSPRIPGRNRVAGFFTGIPASSEGYRSTCATLDDSFLSSTYFPFFPPTLRSRPCVLIDWPKMRTRRGSHRFARAFSASPEILRGTSAVSSISARPLQAPEPWTGSSIIRTANRFNLFVRNVDSFSCSRNSSQEPVSRSGKRIFLIFVFVRPVLRVAAFVTSYCCRHICFFSASFLLLQSRLSEVLHLPF